MSSRMKAIVTPSVLEWARLKAGLSIDEAARRIGRSPNEITSWEDGSGLPSIAQARKAADVYKRPFAVFYLDRPPRDFQVLQDFRRLPDADIGVFSPELSYLVRISKHRQEWARDYLLEEEYEALPFINSASLDDSPDTIAADIRSILGITPKDQIDTPSRYDAFRLWMDRAEAVGIFVFRQRKVSLAEARGFSIADDVAPFIFINSNDSKSGQLFTLAHELAHLWLGFSALTNSEFQWSFPDDISRKIEIICNRIAASSILDDRVFVDVWRDMIHRHDTEESIELSAGYFRVSEEVVARRLLDKGIIEQERYRELREYYKDRWKKYEQRERKKQKESDSGPSYYRTRAVALGYSFTQTVISGYLSGSISVRDASSVLNVKANNLRRLGEIAGLKPSLVEVAGE